MLKDVKRRRRARQRMEDDEARAIPIGRGDGWKG